MRYYNKMIIHATDGNLNYLGCKKVKKASIQEQKKFARELKKKYPKLRHVYFDVEPTDEIEIIEELDDLPF